MKRLLIVVDYQNDFVTGSLGFPEAEFIAQNIAHKITQYRKNGDEIVFTFDTHGTNYLDTQEGRRLPVTHCLEDTEGWQLFDPISPLRDPRDKCFIKSCFGSADLFDYIRHQHYQSMELAGVVTNICVISNAILAKTALPEVPVTIDASCVASNDDSLGEKTLDIMERLHINIINRMMP